MRRSRSRRFVGITALVLVVTAIAGASNASADVPNPGPNCASYNADANRFE